MQKKHLFTIINLVGLVFALVLWVLSATGAMPNFSFAWVVFIATAIWAVSFTVRVFCEKQVILKKSWTILAAVFVVVAAIALICALTVPGKAILPIICLAAAVAALIGSLVLGGKQWDLGDNQKPGYKTYYERKEEERLAKEAAEAAAKAEEEASKTENE